jgi:hypothetical protein
MRQNGVGRQTAAAHDHDEQKGYSTDTKQAPTFSFGAWRDYRLAHGSNAAENQQNDNDEKDQP